MASRLRRTTALALSALLVVMLVPTGMVSAAGPTYPSDAYDPSDNSPSGARDINAMLALTGASPSSAN
jgi:hypothetical protein